MSESVEIRVHQGERVIFFENYTYVHLREGPYLSAGKRFNWQPPTPGLSLNSEILREAFSRGCKIRVFVGDKMDRCFETDPGKWLAYGQRFQIKGVSLFCLPWTSRFFKTVKTFPREIIKCFQEAM